MLNVDLPFFDDTHRQLANDMAAWGSEHVPQGEPEDVDQRCRELVVSLGEAGWLRSCVPEEYGGALPQVDSRSLCIARATLAYYDGLADFAFAIQGLGSGALALSGAEDLRRHYLPQIAAGTCIPAFALSEPDAGSDVAALATTATRDGDAYLIDGCKTWISNGGIADVYTVFARSEQGTGAKGISAFIVPADTAGLHIEERIKAIAPHPMATLRFDGCRVPADHLLGAPGEGFKIAMRTLDIFRASVAAASIGLAHRALDEALRHARQRRMFGQTLAELPVTQAKLADMATAIEGSWLLTAQAAWLRDVKHAPATKEAAMAKMTATESAQGVIDAAVQLFGGLGVKHGHIAERLYREIRALRIYEGATEVQRVVIARALLKEAQR